MLTLVISALAFAPLSPKVGSSRVVRTVDPTMLDRREAVVFAAAAAAATPFAAFAYDGNAKNKAMATYVSDRAAEPSGVVRRRKKTGAF